MHMFPHRCLNCPRKAPASSSFLNPEPGPVINIISNAQQKVKENRFGSERMSKGVRRSKETLAFASMLLSVRTAPYVFSQQTRNAVSFDKEGGREKQGKKIANEMHTGTRNREMGGDPRRW